MKGVIEVPAVAIFTIVAGSLIILLFVLISTTQGAQAQKATQARDLQNIDTLLKSTLTQQNTASNITIIDDTIKFSCDETGVWFGYESDMRLPLYRIIIFSPESLSGGELNAYSSGVNDPYPVTNVLLLASADTRIEATQAAKNLLSDFPFPLLAISGATANRLVRTSGEPAGTKQDVVTINPVPSKSYGTVTFGIGLDAKQAEFLDSATLSGAVLSKDYQTYTCILDQYLQQLRSVNKLEEERLQMLKEHYSATGSTCASLYQQDPYDAIDAVAAKKASDLTADDAEALDQASSEISFMKDRILRGDNCAALY